MIVIYGSELLYQQTKHGHLGTICTYYHCYVFYYTINLLRVCHVSPCRKRKKENTRLTKMLSDLSYEKILRYKNSPPWWRLDGGHGRFPIWISFITVVLANMRSSSDVCLVKVENTSRQTLWTFGAIVVGFFIWFIPVGEWAWQLLHQDYGHRMIEPGNKYTQQKIKEIKLIFNSRI